MKKVLLIAGVLATVGFTSCTKDFECECTDNGTTYTYNIKESKKSAAAAVCEGKGIGSMTMEVAGQEVDITSDTDCTLK